MKHGIIALVLLCVSLPAYANFSEDTLSYVNKIHKQVILGNRRQINGAEAAKIWKKFEADILAALNNKATKLNTKNLNKHYGWKDISVIIGEGLAEDIIKSGAIEVKFHPLPSNAEDGNDWLAVYYHALGAVPSCNFQIFRRQGDSYTVGATMNETEFLNDHPDKQWSAIQLQEWDQKSTFSTYFVPPMKPGVDMNRSQVIWKWTGSKLEALMWYPEVDYHREGDQIVSGRGSVEVIE